MIALFPVRFFTPTAKFFRVVFFDVLGIRKRLILANLDRAFKEQYSKEQKLKIAQSCFESFVLSVFESMRGSHKDMVEVVDFVGREHVEAALKKNQGVIILSLHMGNWEALAAASGKYVAPVDAPVKKVGSKGVNRFVVSTRARYRINCITRKKKGDAMLGIVKGLKENHMIGFMLDQARPGEPRLPFFDTPAKTNTSLAAIWNKLQVPILPGYTIRLSPNRHRVVYLQELKLQNGPTKEEEILKNTLTFSASLEGIIRKHPEQYFWFHDRWKE